MASTAAEESSVIEQIFSALSTEELVIIKKSIADVKNSRGLYSEVANCNGDLYFLKQIVANSIGIDSKSSGVLARLMWHIVKSVHDRERMMKAGVTIGVWAYEDYACKYPSHANLNGKKFHLKKGVRIGIFNHIQTQQLVGCGCFINPILPWDK